MKSISMFFWIRPYDHACVKSASRRLCSLSEYAQPQSRLVAPYRVKMRIVRRHD